MKALSILALAAIVTLSACSTNSENTQSHSDSTATCCDSAAVTDSSAIIPADSALSDTAHND